MLYNQGRARSVIARSWRVGLGSFPSSGWRITLCPLPVGARNLGCGGRTGPCSRPCGRRAGAAAVSLEFCARRRPRTARAALRPSSAQLVHLQNKGPDRRTRSLRQPSQTPDSGPADRLPSPGLTRPHARPGHGQTGRGVGRGRATKHLLSGGLLKRSGPLSSPRAPHAPRPCEQPFATEFALRAGVCVLRTGKIALATWVWRDLRGR